MLLSTLSLVLSLAVFALAQSTFISADSSAANNCYLQKDTSDCIADGFKDNLLSKKCKNPPDQDKDTKECVCAGLQVEKKCVESHCAGVKYPPEALDYWCGKGNPAATARNQYSSVIAAASSAVATFSSSAAAAASTTATTSKAGSGSSRVATATTTAGPTVTAGGAQSPSTTPTPSSTNLAVPMGANRWLMGLVLGLGLKLWLGVSVGL